MHMPKLSAPGARVPSPTSRAGPSIWPWAASPSAAAAHTVLSKAVAGRSAGSLGQNGMWVRLEQREARVVPWIMCKPQRKLVSGRKEMQQDLRERRDSLRHKDRTRQGLGCGQGTKSGGQSWGQGPRDRQQGNGDEGKVTGNQNDRQDRRCQYIGLGTVETDMSHVMEDTETSRGVGTDRQTQRSFEL